MQGHIHQALTLAVYGNAALRGMACAPVWPDGPSFRYSKEVTFVDGPPTAQHNARLAADPPAWFAWLASEAIGAIRLHHVPGASNVEDYNTAVFGGGGRWIVETATPSRSDLWQARSEVVDPKAADQRIWSNTYFRIATDWQKRPPVFADPDKARADLAAILPDILAFAKAHEEKLDFAEYFERGLAALDSTAPLQPAYIADFESCPSLSRPAKQLIGAVGNAWVFGGMSWWNDGGVADAEANKVYLALTQRLWDALTSAIVAAANTSAAPLTQS